MFDSDILEQNMWYLLCNFCFAAKMKWDNIMKNDRKKSRYFTYWIHLWLPHTISHLKIELKEWAIEYIYWLLAVRNLSFGWIIVFDFYVNHIHTHTSDFDSTNCCWPFIFRTDTNSGILSKTCKQAKSNLINALKLERGQSYFVLQTN